MLFSCIFLLACLTHGLLLVQWTFVHSVSVYILLWGAALDKLWDRYHAVITQWSRPAVLGGSSIIWIVACQRFLDLLLRWSWHCIDWFQVHPRCICFKLPKNIQKVNLNGRTTDDSFSRCLLSSSLRSGTPQRENHHRSVDVECPSPQHHSFNGLRCHQHTHGQVDWPTSKVWYTQPDPTPDVVSIAPHTKQVPVNIRSKPRHPGKTDEFLWGPDQAAGWLTFGIKIFKTPTLRELCMHSSKTSKSPCIQSPSTFAVIIKFTAWVSHTLKPG